MKHGRRGRGASGMRLLLWSVLLSMPATAVCGQSVEDKFKAVDANRDGRLDLKEYLSWPERDFKAADKNRDGFVTAEELAEHCIATYAEPLSPGDALILGQAGVNAWDSNRDGKASWAEARAYSEALFSLSDGNGDGVLTLEEFGAFSRNN